MHKLYRRGEEGFNIQSIMLSIVFAVGYFMCAVPSFNNIGKLAFQIFSAAALSFVWTAAGFFIKGSLKFLGVAISLFTVGITVYAIYIQLAAQIKAQDSFRVWIYQFYYDKPMTVAIVWATAVIAVTAVRLFLPLQMFNDGFISDYNKFFKYSSTGFMFFYVCFIAYAFFLQRSPGGQTGFNLIPFNVISDYISNKGAFYENFMYFAGNAFCFLPLGFYIKYYKSHVKWYTILYLPFAVSIGIEVSQLLFSTGYFDIDDIMLNVFGFYLGFLLRLGCNKFRSLVTNGAEKTIF